MRNMKFLGKGTKLGDLLGECSPFYLKVFWVERGLKALFLDPGLAKTCFSQIGFIIAPHLESKVQDSKFDKGVAQEPRPKS